MSEEKTEPNWIEKVFAKYKLGLIIPLLICAVVAVSNLQAGMMFLAFIVFSFIFLFIIGITTAFVMWLLPKKIAAGTRKQIQEALILTLFLGGAAMLGEVLHRENFISEWMDKNVPGGTSIGFIDLKFAAICIFVIWSYSLFRIISGTSDET